MQEFGMTEMSPSPLIYHAPNHILLPHRRHSHAIITPYGRREKNGENKLRLRDYTVLTLTIFSIKLLFPGPSCDPGYLSSQKDFCPASAVTRFCLLQQSGYIKIMARIHFVLTILQFVYSPFFQLNSNFWGHRAIRDISAHSWIFAPPSPPPALVYYNRAAT